MRRYYTDGLAGLISEIALLYAQSLIQVGRFGDAEAALRWVEHFEGQTVLGRVSGEKIAAMRRSLSAAAAPGR